MTKWLIDNESHKYNDIKVVFANTGQEHEETLKFVERCDKEFNFNVVWIEAYVDFDRGKGTGFRIVNYADADRIGTVYKDVIRKYGIPNKKYPHCTRELKQSPIKSYIKNHLRWGKNDYQMAIGIRADEVERVSRNMDKENIIYPLIETNPVDKSFINYWWNQQSFNLNIPEFLGNCMWCWKKSNKKLQAVYKFDSSIFDFPEEMEFQYGSYADGNPRHFFRGNVSAKEIKRSFSSQQELSFDDIPNGCSDSCEVFNE